ncbi:hypothetical protein QZH41_015699 [Actinostola sp. cb2023]|nr:hypothetical protein QZH41_015699 [Actinostola sp. cb2023]
MQVIPVALSGRDVVACAQTGSGKTAAFLLPMIARIHHITGVLSSKSKLLRHPLGLILAPTRELCMQIEKQAKELIQGLTNMRTALIVGGLPLPPQLHRLQMGVQMIIATPGRLLEILSRDELHLTDVRYFVLDEVDSMLQLGFDHQVQEIMEKLDGERQTVVVSATIPSTVENMASKLTHNPVFISDPKHYQPPVVVFVDSRIGADMLAEAVQQVCNIPCVSMHGDKEQTERNNILQLFIEGRYPVIVCTGVLGRGVDLLHVKQIINFDMPSTVEEYIHQVGRAGRLGTSGVALTFINNNNKRVFLDLIEALSPLGVTLPAELINSCHLQHQTGRKKQGVKRKERDEIVNQGNLMNMLTKISTRRKRT